MMLFNIIEALPGIDLGSGKQQDANLVHPKCLLKHGNILFCVCVCVFRRCICWRISFTIGSGEAH